MPNLTHYESYRIDSSFQRLAHSNAGLVFPFDDLCKLLISLKYGIVAFLLKDMYNVNPRNKGPGQGGLVRLLSAYGLSPFLSCPKPPGMVLSLLSWNP